MSPTQTCPGPAGASASTSTGSAAHDVTPTVLPVARVDGEDAAGVAGVVGGDDEPGVRRSATSPLDSTMSGSVNRNAGPSPAVERPAAAPSRKGTATSTPAASRLASTPPR